MKLMFVTLRIILKNIMKGVILSFRSFFFYLLSFPTLVMEVRQLERRPNLIIFRFFFSDIQFSRYKPQGGFYLEGRFNGRFFALPVWRAYFWRGLYSKY